MSGYLESLGPLRLTSDTARARERRWQAVLEARSWPRGPSVDEKLYVAVSPSFDGLTVR